MLEENLEAPYVFNVSYKSDLKKLQAQLET